MIRRLRIGICWSLILILIQLPTHALDLNLGNIDLKKIGSIISNASDATTDVSDEKERQIGTSVAANLLGAAPLVEDKQLQEYVNRGGSVDRCTIGAANSRVAIRRIGKR